MTEGDALRIHVVPRAPGPAINLVDTLLRAADGRPAAEPRFEPLHAWARDHVALADDAGDADLVLYPSDAKLDLAGADAAAERAERAGRTCLFFDAGDTWRPFALSRGVLYRTSLHRTLARPNERAMPAFVRDARAEAAALGVDATPARGGLPTVGFCGYVGSRAGRAKALLSGQFQKWRGLHLRARATRALAASPDVRSDLVTRAAFGGGADKDAARRAEREAFLRNVLGNRYTLCTRGKGNFSFRLYEVLAAGRVPLFLDTKCVLPFEDELRWRELVAWCDEGELAKLGARCRAFDEAHDAAARGEELRRTWFDYLSPLGFVRQLARRHAPTRAT